MPLKSGDEMTAFAERFRIEPPAGETVATEIDGQQGTVVGIAEYARPDQVTFRPRKNLSVWQMHRVATLAHQIISDGSGEPGTRHDVIVLD
ncbi:hypothetical protein ABZ413_29690 [Nocardia rhamnosiphila]|uniref:hypothetical protein n=1 Tax=Nocardia rhamnosiphila TaxID=426716 RepID=UPI0033DE0CEF